LRESIVRDLPTKLRGLLTGTYRKKLFLLRLAAGAALLQ
jgi:hypothetical protein